MVAKLELDPRGLKRICTSCGNRFYDLNKRPITCPTCETEFTGEMKVKARRGRVAAEATESKVKKTTKDDDDDAPIIEVDDEDDAPIIEADDDDDTISINDLDDDDDDDDDLDDDLGDLNDLEPDADDLDDFDDSNDSDDDDDDDK